jgi:hypothetical protein
MENIVAIHLLPFFLLKVFAKAGAKKALAHRGAHHSLTRKVAKEGAKQVAERAVDSLQDKVDGLQDNKTGRRGGV